MFARRKVNETSIVGESASYVTDIEYIYASFEELMPVNLAFCAAMNGFNAVDLSKPFNYLDLGCGHANTLLAAAAVFPEASFYGVDMMPDHIAYVQKVADACELNNIHCHAKTFSALSLRKLPQCDFIVTHGVMSWVSDEERGQLMRIVSKKLKKEGVFFFSYNALPGWSVKQPFLELAQYFTDEAESSVERIRKAMTLMNYMQNEKAGYFSQNPVLKQELELMNNENINYLAHEYLLGNWKAFYFHQMNDYMSQFDFQYAATFPYRSNFNKYVVSKNLVPLVRAQKTRESAEEMKDFITNNRFRKDIYVRSHQQRGTDFEAIYDRVKDFYCASFLHRDLLKPAISLGGLTYHLEGAGYEALRDLLTQEAYRIEDLLQHERFSGLKQEEVFRILIDFIVLNQATVFSRPPSKNDIRAGYQPRWHIPSAYNRYMLENLLTPPNRIAIACPEVGCFIHASVETAVVLHSLVQAKGEVLAAVPFAMQRNKEFANRRLFDNEPAVLEMIQRMKSGFWPWLFKLGIVE